MPANMIFILELSQRQLIGGRIAFQPGNALLDRPPKTGADFKSIVQGRFDVHHWLLRSRLYFIELRLAFYKQQLKFPRHEPILKLLETKGQITDSQSDRVTLVSKIEIVY
jgi:hypothetical protein